MTENTLAVPSQMTVEAQKIIRECSALVANYKGFIIQTQQQYDEAGTVGKMAGEKLKQVEAMRKAITEPVENALAELKAPFTPVEKQLKELKQLLSGKVGAYLAEQEQKRQDEQRRLDEYRAEKERKAREAAEKARAAGNEAKAEKLEAKADAVATAPVIAAPTVERAQGVKMRTYYRARIVDPDAVPREFCTPDEEKLRKYAEAMKGTGKVAGVVFYVESKAAFGGK